MAHQQEHPGALLYSPTCVREMYKIFYSQNVGSWSNVLHVIAIRAVMPAEGSFSCGTYLLAGRGGRQETCRRDETLILLGALAMRDVFFIRSLLDEEWQHPHPFMQCSLRRKLEVELQNLIGHKLP